MSTSLLYHNQQIMGVQVTRTRYAGGITTHCGEVSKSHIKCSNCHSYKVMRSGGASRRFRLLPTGSRQNRLVLFIPRVKCRECGKVGRVQVPFADRGKSYTRALARYVLELSRLMPLTDIARLCGLCWDTVKEIHKIHLCKKYRRIRLKKVRYIGIDEVCVGYPRKYLTLVIDLESGHVLHVGRGKGAAALMGFWRRLRPSRARILAVSTDMASGYMSAVREHLPEATLVLDRFHLVKYMNDKLTLLRRTLQREADDEGRKVLKGTRWLLLTSRKKMKDVKRSDDLRRLDDALKLNHPLYVGYYLKEELRELWKRESKDEARSFLGSWLQQAKESGVGVLRKAAEWLESVEDAILAWFDYPISSGKLEALNGGIRRLLKNTCGLRDMEYFYLRIHDLGDEKTSGKLFAL